MNLKKDTYFHFWVKKTIFSEKVKKNFRAPKKFRKNFKKITEFKKCFEKNSTKISNLRRFLKDFWAKKM